MSTVQNLYHQLWNTYGPQGWWPIFYSEDVAGFHKTKYYTPSSLQGKFEVCLGAILTQNTSWTNAQQALSYLSSAGLLSSEKLLAYPTEELASIIRCSGYYRQKAKKISVFATWWQSRIDKDMPPLRSELLDLWGIGMETADSILCYAYHEPVFVSDAYTKRLFLETGLLSDPQASYIKVQELGQQIQPLKGQDITIAYQEFHALIVQHMKVINKRKQVKTLQ